MEVWATGAPGQSPATPPEPEPTADCAADDRADQTEEVLMEWVGNATHARNHRVAVGPPADQRLWKTICGWPFGQSSCAVLSNPAYASCRKCLRLGGPGMGEAL